MQEPAYVPFFLDISTALLENTQNLGKDFLRAF